MRKGALKKKEKQLQELHLDRCEALGELVVGMYVQGDWDDDLLARGSAEVREVERELALLSHGDRQPDPDDGVFDDATGDFPPTGEYTQEHDLPATGEHVLRPPGEHTEEHLLPSWRDTPPQEPVASEAAKDQPAAGPETGQPPTLAPSPSATARVTPEPKAPAAPPVSPQATAESSPAAGATKPAAAAPVTEEPSRPSTAPAAAAPSAADRLDQLSQKIEADQRRARNAAEAARATLKTETHTERAVISKDVADGQKQLATALAAATALISDSKRQVADTEAKLTRETARGRERAAEWVRAQAAEIEADAALAIEMGQSGTDAAGETSGADAALTAKIAVLEAELARERADRSEVLAEAETRLKAIEDEARLAEQRVAAAEAAVSAAGPQPTASEPANRVASAEAREAAVTWLRGQIAALRREIAQAGTETSAPSKQDGA